MINSILILTEQWHSQTRGDGGADSAPAKRSTILMTIEKAIDPVVG